MLAMHFLAIFLKCRCIVSCYNNIFYQVPFVSNYFIFANPIFQGRPYIFDRVEFWIVARPVQKSYNFTRLLLDFLKSLNKINLLDKKHLSIIIQPPTVQDSGSQLLCREIFANMRQPQITRFFQKNYNFSKLIFIKTIGQCFSTILCLEIFINVPHPQMARFSAKNVDACILYLRQKLYLTSLACQKKSCFLVTPNANAGVKTTLLADKFADFFDNISSYQWKNVSVGLFGMPSNS